MECKGTEHYLKDGYFSEQLTRTSQCSACLFIKPAVITSVE